MFRIAARWELQPGFSRALFLLRIEMQRATVPRVHNAEMDCVSPEGASPGFSFKWRKFGRTTGSLYAACIVGFYAAK